jgi:hypothetical protein
MEVILRNSQVVWVDVTHPRLGNETRWPPKAGQGILAMHNGKIIAVSVSKVTRKPDGTLELYGFEVDYRIVPPGEKNR